MIHAHFKQNKSDDYVSFEMKGHANAGPYGYDIVCAAASALSINAVNSIYQLAEYAPLTDVSDGYLYFETLNNLSDRQVDMTNILIQSLLIGLSEIQTEYPEFMKISKD